MATQQVPAVGRIVHFVTDPEFREAGLHRPAIIVHVWSPDPFSGTCQLQVFTDGNGIGHNDGTPNVVWKTSVVHDEAEKRPGTWHWPEFVPSVEVPD